MWTGRRSSLVMWAPNWREARPTPSACPAPSELQRLDDPVTAGDMCTTIGRRCYQRCTQCTISPYLTLLDLHWRTQNGTENRLRKRKSAACRVHMRILHPHTFLAEEGRRAIIASVGIASGPIPRLCRPEIPSPCPIPASCRGVFGSANPFDQPSAGRQRDCTSVDATPNTLYKTFCGCIRKRTLSSCSLGPDCCLSVPPAPADRPSGRASGCCDGVKPWVSVLRRRAIGRLRPQRQRDGLCAWPSTHSLCRRRLAARGVHLIPRYWEYCELPQAPRIQRSAAGCLQSIMAVQEGMRRQIAA